MGALCGYGFEDWWVVLCGGGDVSLWSSIVRCSGKVLYGLKSWFEVMGVFVVFAFFAFFVFILFG